MRKRTGLMALALTGCLFVGCGCNMDSEALRKFMEARQGKTPKEEVKLDIPVEAALPHRGDISEFADTTNRVTAEVSVDVTPESIEKCIALYVDEGDTVERGQVLAELDKKDLETQIQEQQTQVAKHKSDLDRAKRALELEIGPQVDYDNARFSYEQGLSSLQRLRLERDNLTIRAPISGVVTMKSIQVGQLVASGTPVFRVVDPNTFVLIITRPEQEMSRLREGQVAQVTLDALGDEVFEAKVRKINPHVDASGTFKVTLEFEGEARSRLQDGLFARVRLVMETHENALLVPKEAIVEENARKHLFVVARAEGATQETGEDAGAEASASEAAPDGDDMLVAQRVEVETGLETSDVVEILSGIDDETLVITLGQQTLKPGSPIKVTNAEAELYAKSGLSAQEALEAAKAAREAGAKDVTRQPNL